MYKVHEILEPKSGKVHRIYTYNGKPCRRIKINGHLAVQLAGYTLIEKDLRSTLIWLAEIESLHTEGIEGEHSHARDRVKYNVIKGLFVASLTFYSKCFTTAEGRKIKLDRNQLSEEFRECHDYHMRFRHNFAAHSGHEKIEFAEVVLVIPIKDKKNKIAPVLYSELLQPDLASSVTGEVAFKDLVNHTRNVVMKKIESLRDKIMKDEIIPKGREYWIKYKI